VKKITLEGKSIPPRVVEGIISFPVTSLLFHMMRMNKLSSKRLEVVLPIKLGSLATAPENILIPSSIGESLKSSMRSITKFIV
jgi:hypothetical protein